MLVLFKAEEGGKMQPEEYFTYFEDCIFHSDKGFGQKRAFIDSLQWGLAQITMNNPKPLDAGDGAYEAQYSDALAIKVLAKDRAVIYVRASNDSRETALDLYRLGLKYLPEK